jgi:hypothetical protein
MLLNLILKFGILELVSLHSISNKDIFKTQLVEIIRFR